MNYIKLTDYTTPKLFIGEKYYRAKEICSDIWSNPSIYFADIFHDTIYNCLNVLGNTKYELDYMKNYFFKSFRINMVRHYNYSYNKLKSGTLIENVLIPVENNFETHMDGFSMLDYVKNKYGLEKETILWDNLNGITYKELNEKYHCDSYRLLDNIKNELKCMYLNNG